MTPTLNRSTGAAVRGWPWPVVIFVLLTVALPRMAAQAAPMLPPPDVLKKLSIGDLMNLEVTSVSRRPEKLVQAASAIQVITGEDIISAGVTSLPEALRLASNLEVARIDSHQWAISARGFNNLFADKLLVSIDGRSVYTPLFAGVYWDVQDVMLEDVNRIEVISGPGATQWGANAVNGVINVITRNARATQGALVTVGLGSAVRSAAAVRYGGQIGANVFYRVYAKATNREETFRHSGARAGDDWRLRQAGFRADWDPETGGGFTVQGDAYAGTISQPVAGAITVSGGNLLGRLTRVLANGSELKVQAYFDATHRRMPKSFTQDIATYDIDFQHRFSLGRIQEVIWGGGYRLIDDAVVNTPANAFVPADARRQWYSGFVQDDVTLVPQREHVLLGTKIEHDPYTGVELEPSVRATWTPDSRETWWAAVSRAVRTPSRIDRDLYSPAVPPYRIQGGSQVVSEKLLAYEIGYRIQATPRLLASVAAFCDGYHDLRSLEPLNPPAAFPVMRSSGLRGRAAGLEASVDWRLIGGWRLHAGYTELQAHTELQVSSGARPAPDSVVRDPHRWATLRSVWHYNAHWEFDANLRYVAAIASQRVPAYAEANLRLAYHPTPDWEVAVTGENLLHARHGEFNYRRARREIPRAVFAKATWLF